MKCLQEDLRLDLIRLTEGHLKEVRKWKSLDSNRFHQEPNAKAWSAADCAEHLCRYGDFYLPECKSRLQEASPNQVPSALQFKSSRLGEYFAKSMWPQEKLNTMNAFKSMNPTYSETRLEVLEEFENQLEDWLVFLKVSAPYDWTRIRTSISISKFIRLRLGDSLRVVFYHNERHIRQAKRALGEK